MRKLLLILAFLGSAFWLSAQAQERRITGTVRDAVTNEQLPGVTVLVKGTSTGTITDMNGTYSISVDPNATLVFSFVGYQKREVPVGNRSVIDVQLEEDIEQLQEVVVVGYGTQEKKDITGAVSSVSAEDFNQGVIASPEELIQGKSAGVQITQASGEPGAGVNIRIRGTSSVRGGNNPLFVVDGVPLAGEDIMSGGQDIGRGTSSARNPLNFLNPNDIQSIDILKDASATAIYGSRGANGVVLITTKTGRGKRQTLEYGSQLSLATPANTFDLLDREQYLSSFEEIGGDVAEVDQGADTDWQDVVFRTAISHKHDLSYGNAYKTGHYRISLGYQNQQGIVENSALERLSARVNWNQTFFNEKLNLGIQGTVSRLNDEQAAITNNAGFEGDLIGVTYMANPTWPADPEAQFSTTIANPSSLLAYYQDNAHTNRQLVNVSLDYDITEGLNFKVSGGYDNSSSNRGAVFSPQLQLGSGIFENGRGFIGEVENENLLLEYTLNYEKSIGDNSELTALVGYSFQQFNRDGTNILGWGFPNPNMDAMVDDLQASADAIRAAIDIPYQQFGYDDDIFFANSLFPEVRTVELNERVPDVPVRSVAADKFAVRDELQSFFGRVNYSLADKYLFTGTLRVDGSTRFGGNNKYGYFPSAAFAWRLSEENFVPDLFYDLKLRLGYGVTGNQEIPHNLHQRRQRYGGISIQDAGNIQAPSLSDVAFNNPDLTWEQTSQINLGLDFDFAGGRFGGSIDLYRKVTTDLLIRVETAQPAPQPFTFRNLDAEVINRGIELALNWNAISTENVGLEFGFNGSYNENMVENYFGAPLNTGAINGQGLTGAFAQRIANEQPLYSYFIREWEGIYQEGPLEGLNIISEDVQQFIGANPLPSYNLGFNANFSYKQWTFAAYMYGLFDYYVYNNTANAFFTIGSLGSGRNITEEALAEAIALGESPANTPEPSTRFLEKGDFLRMQNLNLGYNFNLGEGFLRALRIYGSAQNLFVLTNYSGLDPEVNTDKSINGVPSAGIDYTSYPRARTFTIGLNATF